MSRHRGKIFGIGLNKTATTTLHEALLLLGYRSFHWGGPEAAAAVQRALDEGRPLLHHLGPDLDAVTDRVEITEHFDLADRQYPGSKFILTTRAEAAWLDSRRRHVERNQELRARGAYHGAFLEVDEDAWREERAAHEARVRAYFADRPGDLLVVDLTAGGGWEPLCTFLGCPEPDVPFPWANRHA